MCLANMAKIEDARALEQRLREAADLCNQQQLGLAMLLVMAADMIQQQHRLLMGSMWMPIDSAPHGEPGMDVGSRDPSEYFIAWISNPRARRRLRVVRRIYDSGYAFADFDRDTLYEADFFSHWQRLPEGPAA